MDKMTDSRAVDVLSEMLEGDVLIDEADYVAAIDHAIARLREPAEAQPGYSIDADPAGIRARTADAITGALGFGAQGSHRPPVGHWLEPFWDMARADAVAKLQAEAKTHGYVAALRAEQARAVMPLIGPLLDAWDRVHPDDSVHDSGIASYLDPIKHAMTSDEAIPAEAQAQGGGEVVAEVLQIKEGTAVVALFDDSLRVGNNLYTAPPSTPVGASDDYRKGWEAGRIWQRALAQQPSACDIGALCIGCEPRNDDGACPGRQPAADEEAAEQYRNGWEAGHAAAQQPAAVDGAIDVLWRAVGKADRNMWADTEELRDAVGVVTAALCRRWLAVEGAQIREVEEEMHGLVIRAYPLKKGQRVRIVPEQGEGDRG